jgi:hypothetical protein
MSWLGRVFHRMGLWKSCDTGPNPEARHCRYCGHVFGCGPQ